MKLGCLDKTIIRKISSDISCIRKPFRKIAKDLKISQEQLLGRLSRYQRQGLLKGIMPRLDYNRLGYKYNALVGWRIAKINNRLLQDKLQEMKNISHCVIRKEQKLFPYNLYTMVHAKNLQGLDKAIKRLKNDFGVKRFQILATIKKLKKTHFKYDAEKF